MITHKTRTARLRKVMAAIRANPKRWDQSRWHCGTTHCFAGWAQILAGKVRLRKDGAVYKADIEACQFPIPHQDAEKWLGITWEQGHALFFFANSLNQLQIVVDAIIENPNVSHETLYWLKQQAKDTQP